MDVNCVFYVVPLGIIADHTEYEAVVSENYLTKWKEKFQYLITTISLHNTPVLEFLL